MRVAINKLNGILIESQSNGETHPDPKVDNVEYAQANLDILKQNAINAGYNEEDIEVKFVTDEEFALIPTKTQAELDAEEVVAVKAKKKVAKVQSILDNLPSWSQVEAKINDISNMTEVKAFLLQLSRVVYRDFDD